ncbi:hypothetical protein JHK82_040250 [Glycine max]|uniref:Uncharacterized protein n=2 Tax=Glycine subgen. Soja TaxID=1462606 RepID=K7M7H0_SOYBN|nr:hypothetical protein JHK87_040261 [Glycine soja]KAG4966058.1 hypothetical protein JHK85_041033 [Glycine max]KAG5111027.1 hypothetical protein JHK82_040250 [Glycine max]KAG5122316.1 hypothetical protein JHK84_040656 [Glycine max]KAH1094915.1 hypothetical protein GYH30_040284 [Glycine max]
MASKTLILVLLVSFPAQGLVNPLLRLDKHLAAKGCFVTFSTTKPTGEHMRFATNNNATIDETSSTPMGDGFFAFNFFDDSLGDGDHPERHNLSDTKAHLERIESKSVPR